MAKKEKVKSKSFSEQLASLFTKNKAKADNPNTTTGKRPDQSIADFIGFPGGEDKPKKKKRK